MSFDNDDYCIRVILTPKSAMYFYLVTNSKDYCIYVHA